MTLSCRLFLVTVFGLYLELLAIRWIGTEIRIFAYLQNTILVVCFFGLGLGCLVSERPFRLKRLLYPLLALMAAMAIPASRSVLRDISQLLSSLSDFVIFSPWLTDDWITMVGNVCVGLALTFLVLILLFETFLPIGQLIGRMMDSHPRVIQAYSINIIASLIGVWLFVGFGALQSGPLAWFALVVAFLLYLVIFEGERSPQEFILALLLLPLAFVAASEPNSIETHWSPYQKLVFSVSSSEREEMGEYTVRVNNANYQEIIDLSKAKVAADPEKFPPALRDLGQYDLPYAFHPAPKKVLIVGSGTGNDVAAALRHGAESVTAVDIDPAIIDLGKRFHPESPYSSPKVRVVNDDARSFFASTTDTYDMVIFGLLDSHASTSMTNARLDHYVYTKESIERARELLKPDGVMVLSFFSIRLFITDRFERTLREVFGFAPVVFRTPTNNYGRGGTFFVSGAKHVIDLQLSENTALTSKIDEWLKSNPLPLSGKVEVATDNWPYIYLENRSIPVLYYLLALLITMLVVYAHRRFDLSGVVARWNTEHWHFFLLGAGFLLLEVQNISRASVVLGNTWVVNAVIISGILVMNLIANLIALRFPRLPLAPAYMLLFLSCVGLYFLDLSVFAGLPYLTKSLIVGTVTTLPCLFSGIVFIFSFAASEKRDVAMGANLLGSLAGGLLQSLTFVVGVKALLIVVLAVYLLALKTASRKI